MSCSYLPSSSKQGVLRGGNAFGPAAKIAVDVPGPTLDHCFYGDFWVTVLTNLQYYPAHEKGGQHMLYVLSSSH